MYCTIFRRAWNWYTLIYIYLLAKACFRGNYLVKLFTVVKISPPPLSEMVIYPLCPRPSLSSSSLSPVVRWMQLWGQRRWWRHWPTRTWIWRRSWRNSQTPSLISYVSYTQYSHHESPSFPSFSSFSVYYNIGLQGSTFDCNPHGFN